MKVHIEWEDGHYFLRLNRAHSDDHGFDRHALCQECVTAEPGDPEAVDADPWFVRHYLATLDQYSLVQSHLGRLDRALDEGERAR